jgi:hypothetical protein
MAERTERILSASERLYLLMIGFYPKEFRSEFGREMFQSFRDGNHEELSRGGVWALLPFWGETALDLAATVSIEHLKRRKAMDPLEKDLRWDLRYGLQMFLRHSQLVFKYVICASLMLPLAAIVGSVIYREYKQARVNTVWKEATGQTPDEVYQSVLRRFPQGTDNRTTMEIGAIGEHLGIFQLEADKGETLPIWCGVHDVPPYVKEQLERETDDIAEPSQDVKTYLRNHAEDLNKLENLVLRLDAPRWDTNLGLLTAAPVPNLRSLLRLYAALALDSLHQSRLGRNRDALKGLEVSWKINESLRERPDVMSQYIALAGLNMQLGILRKLKVVPLDWEQRMAAVNLQEPVMTALKFDAVTVSMELGEGEIQHVADSFSWSGVGKQFGRVVAVRFLDVAGMALGRLKLTDGCSFDPDRFQHEIEESLPSWLSAGMSVAFARLWKTVAWTRLNLELTQRVLQLRRLQPASESHAIESMRVSSLCPDAKWEHQIMADGGVLVSCSWFPNWANRETELGSLPLRYTLKTEPRTQGTQ